MRKSGRDNFGVEKTHSLEDLGSSHIEDHFVWKTTSGTFPKPGPWSHLSLLHRATSPNIRIVLSRGKQAISIHFRHKSNLEATAIPHEIHKGGPEIALQGLLQQKIATTIRKHQLQTCGVLRPK